MIHYRVELLEPALLTALEGDPNSAVSFDYVPGSVVRGMVIGAWMRECNQGQLDADNSPFFNGGVTFLNAYPVIDEQRALPTPITWRRPKKGAASSTWNVDANPNIDEKKTDLDGYFVWPKGGTLHTHLPEKLITVHIQRGRIGVAAFRARYGSNADERLVYQYEPLAAGQTFEGVIRCDDAKLETDIRKLLDNREWSLGGARTAGYGRVCFTLRDDPPDGWREAGDSLSDTPIIMTLLSDAIVRDPHGEYDAGLATLCRVLGIDLAHVEKAKLDTTMVGGFNRKWGLPLPQTIAIAKGSTLQLVPGSIDLATAQALEANGIGERRAEGFGRVGFNLADDYDYVFAPQEQPQQENNPVPLGNDQRKALRTQLLDLSSSVEAAS